MRGFFVGALLTLAACDAPRESDEPSSRDKWHDLRVVETSAPFALMSPEEILVRSCSISRAALWGRTGLKPPEQIYDER